MKKLLLSLFIVGLATVAFSQSVESEVQQIMEDEGYTLSISKYAYLSEGETYSHWKTFYEGNDYIIVCFPEDDGVDDADLYLYDDDGSLYDKATTDDNVEVIEFTCYTTREMKIMIKNYDSYSSYSSYEIKFMVFYK